MRLSPGRALWGAGLRDTPMSRAAGCAADVCGRNRAEREGSQMPGAERMRVESFGHPEDGLEQATPWYQWGPYLSERAWGTVREDYSAGGEAWDYFPDDHARSRAYRWGEDGMAGV